MEQLSARLLLTAGILLLIAGVIFAILQVWLYTDLLWAGAWMPAGGSELSGFQKRRRLKHTAS